MEWEDFNENDINWPIKKGEKVYHYLFGWGNVTDYYICQARWWVLEIGVTFEGENKPRWFSPIGTLLKYAWSEGTRVELSKTKYNKLEEMPLVSKEEFSERLSLLTEKGREKARRNGGYKVTLHKFREGDMI